MNFFPHFPVLLSELVQAFTPLFLEGVIDGTLGAGGHAEALLKTHPEIEYYLGIDQDGVALSLAEERLQIWSSKMRFKRGNFDQIDAFLMELSLPRPNAILADLGVSSMQLDEPLRGFSFMQDGPLDMRMNPDNNLTAAEIINTRSENELGKIFRDYGEEKQWRRAAHLIVEARKQKPLLRTNDLKEILTPALARFAKKGRHPLTLIFQALRIAVNHELDVLETFLDKALEILAPKGRLAVISFHSLEDRIVKNKMRLAASDKWETSGIGGLFQNKEPTVKLITKKPIEASEEEIRKNPRSRSAKLRVVEKLEGH